MVAGFTSFMLISATVTGAVVNLSYDHYDPLNPAVVLFTRFVVALAISVNPQVAVFGAFAGVAPAESWISLGLRFVNTSGAVGAGVTSPRLFCTAR
jgi:hypothetical protein